MVDIKDLRRIFDYCKDRDNIGFPEIQYELAITYTKTRELIEFMLEKGWLSKNNNAYEVDHARIPPIRKTQAVCEELVIKIKARKINGPLLEALVSRGSLPISEINKVLTLRLNALATMHARQLQNVGLAYIIDNVLYPTIGADILEHLKGAGVI